MTEATKERRRDTVIAFLAGAVAMLALVLVWGAFSGARQTVSALRADLAIAHTPSLPAIPLPPPQGHRMPEFPAPGPR